MHLYTKTHIKLTILFFVFFQNLSSVTFANDSDFVNCNHAWKIVILGSSTAYGTGATTYDSSWAGKFTSYISRKNTSNQVINLAISGLRTYQNLRPTGYIPPSDRPYPNSTNNITAAIAYHPDAIIINMPSNDAADNYSLAEQQANFEAAMYLADSARIPVWVTTTQPRNYLNALQTQSLIDMKNWIQSRFGNKSVNFWDDVANPDGTINPIYGYDYVHVNNLGHQLFYSRMLAETILDSLCNRLLNPCNFSVSASISGIANACGNMGIGDSAVYSINATDASSFLWSVSNSSTMGISVNRASNLVKIKYSSSFTSGTIIVNVTGCNNSIISRSLSITKTIPGAPSSITDENGNAATSYICPFIGGNNVTYVATPPASNASSVISYRWTLPLGALLVRVNNADSSSITIRFPSVPLSQTLSVVAVSGCGNSSSKTLILNSTIPVAPSTITGLTDICPFIGNATQSENVTYTASISNNAASYLWSIPSGVTLISGQGSNIINVKFSATFISGTISVQAISPCGNSGIRSILVYKRMAAAPTTIQKEYFPTWIAAVTNVCGVNSEIYKIRKIAYATSYNWSFNLGTKVTINHINGLGINDTAVIVTFLSGFTKDTLSVNAVTACNVSATKTLVLSANLLPPTPTNIISNSGNYNPCLGNQVSYSVAVSSPTSSQTAATFYRWTIPINSSIIAATTDSSTVTIKFNTGYAGGVITAKGQTACGQIGTAKAINLQYLPPTPKSIASSRNIYNACIGSTLSFSVVVSIPTSTQIAASIYRWTKPAYTTIISANSDSSTITLSFNTGYTGGSLSVKGQTPCGVLGNAKTQFLTHVGCSSGTKIASRLETETLKNEAYISPNPNNGSFMFRAGRLSKKNNQATLMISDINGRVIATFQLNAQNDQFEYFVKQLQLRPGIYFVRIIEDGYSSVTKMIITE